MANDLHGPDRDAALETIRQVARPADELASVIRTRDFTQLRDRVRNRPPGDLAIAPRRPQPRRPGRRLSSAAAPHRRGDVRISLARRAGSAAESDGARGRGGAPQRHGARRSHDVPRRAARAGDASAPGAAHAGRTLRRRRAARLSRRLDRPPDDAALRRGARGLDRPGRARLHPRERPGQRNAQRHLRRRRTRPADRRRAHPRVPADVAVEPRLGADGSAVRGAQGDRRSADRGGGLPQVRSRGAARHRHRRRPHRHRHD